MTEHGYTESCKDCGKTIYWVQDLGVWYHWNQIDMLTCPAERITPADRAEV
jgi:hypothetical protein